MLVWTFSLRWFEYHSISVQVDSLKTHRQQSSPSRDTLHMDGSVGRANPDDDLNLPANSTWELLHCRRPAATLRCFFRSLLGNFLYSLRHARKDSRNDLKHTKDPTDRFQSSFRFVLLDLIRLYKAIIRFPLMPGTSKNCYAWCKLDKNTEPRCLERQKCLRCGAEKIKRCQGVSKHLRFPPHKMLPIFCCQIMDSTKSKREVVVSYMLCSRSWRLSVLQPLVESMPNTRNNHPVGFKSMWKKRFIVFNCSSIWCGYVEQKKWWTVHFA